jgi:D-amino-acid dehydrogenase
VEDAKDNMAKQSGYNSRGGVSVSYEPVQEVVAASRNPTGSKMSYEPYRQLIGEEIFQQEPSLRFQERQPTTAKFEFEAKSASSERFTKELAARCTNDPALDVTFLYGTAVQAITVAEPSSRNGKPRISELRTNRGVVAVPADVKVVIAAGTWTPHVLALMNLYAPVYPLKGYAMSVTVGEALKANPSLKPYDLPSRIVSDKYMYTSRLGDEIRITSIGEFSGWSTKPTQHVDSEFRREAIHQFPQLQNSIDNAPTRCGHRPYINDGILLLGAVDTHDNLFVSCGPGSNGWKLAMGSGEIIERLVAGQTAEQISQDLEFDANAFSPAGRVLKAPFFAKLCRARWDV